MPLEKSVLDVEKISAILENEYGLHLVCCERLAAGSANCFKVTCKEGNFFFKEYQSGFTPETVETEAGIVEYLGARDFPVAGFVRTVNGNSCTLYEDRVIGVQDFVEGQTHQNDLPRPLLLESAKYLGEMHAILRDYPLVADMDYDWASESSKDAIARKFNALLTALDKDKSDPHYRKIREDVLFKKELTASINDWKEYFKDVTFTATHGDYSSCQLIRDEKGIKAVVDFSSAKRLPAVWEIMRSYVQSGGISRSGSEFDIADFSLYVKEYMKYAPLTERDLKAMPYIYLFQLAQSSYGYKEYLITKTENKEDLLAFAFWRTDICREIYRKAEDISEAIAHGE